MCLVKMVSDEKSHDICTAQMIMYPGTVAVTRVPEPVETMREVET